MAKKQNRGSALAQPIHGRKPAEMTGIGLLMAIVILLPFSRMLTHEFVNFDDAVYIYQNDRVTEGLSVKGIVSAFDYRLSDNWTPLTTVSHMLAWAAFGSNAGGHHAVNLFLHVTAAILLFVAFTEMTGFRWRSAMVALIFAVHPLRVESVAWASERKDVLCAVFFALTLWAYARYAKQVFSVRRYLAVLVCFACGLLSKPMLVSLPFLLLLLDYWPLKRLGFGGAANARTNSPPGSQPTAWRLVVEKIPLLGLSALVCLLTVLSQQTAIAPTDLVPMPDRIGNAVVSYAIYITKIFFPSGLAIFYPYPAGGWSALTVAGAALLLVCVTICAVLFRRSHPYLPVAWLWYLGMLVPVLGLFQVGLQARADRYTYLTQIGLYMALVWFVAGISNRWRRREALNAGLSVLTIGSLVLLTGMQVAHWKNSETLWTRALAVTSRNDVAHFNYGNVLLQQGRHAEAVDQFDRAASIRPGSAEYRDHLGRALLQSGRIDEAITRMEEASALKPENAYYLNHLGSAYYHRGELSAAIDRFRRALDIKPEDAAIRNNLGLALAAQGEFEGALEQYRMALAAAPSLDTVHCNMGIAYTRLGRIEEAADAYEEALKLNPANSAAHNGLGTLLLRVGHLEPALFHYRKALENSPANAAYHNNIGYALFQMGRTEEAIDHYQKAISLVPDYSNAHYNLAVALTKAGAGSAAAVHFEKAAQSRTSPASDGPAP